ncbi:MAG TPA: SprT-like domain-containing protein [Gemmatimonadales bacterium]|nr:SprT-like domain-containing protein [Gemmatimonadales bacterium]
MTAPARSSGDIGRHNMLESRLAILGLRGTTSVICHNNRTVMLSFTRTGVLRLHQGYASAPDRVLRAIVRFLNPRVPRSLRRAAEREFLAFPVEAHAPCRPPPRQQEGPRVGDVALLHRLESLHQTLNAAHFGGQLGRISIRLSSRMRIRLGELAVDIRSGQPLEITISRRHLARHPWPEIEHTMLHEMVHQWQAETGLRIDHGRTFRQKAREVGVLPAAKRTLNRAAGGPAGSGGPVG